MRVAIIGAGKVGTALAILFKKKGHEIVGISSRTIESASRAGGLAGAPYATVPDRFTRNADIVFITTPDREIEPVCQQVAGAGGFTSGTIVTHCSGAHSSVILASAAACGGRLLSFHPLQSFASPEVGVKNLPGSYISLEGDDEAVAAARKLVDDLGCRPLQLPTEGKPLYHASACIACNYLVVLLHLSLQVMEQAGINRKEAYDAFYPLLQGTLSNIKQVGAEKALTGPVARGDAATIRTHLEEMSAKIPTVLPYYKLLGAGALEIAVKEDKLSESAYEELLTLFGGVSSGQMCDNGDRSEDES